MLFAQNTKENESTKMSHKPTLTVLNRWKFKGWIVCVTALVSFTAGSLITAHLKRILLFITTILICACLVQGEKGAAEPEYYPMRFSGDTWIGEVPATKNATKNVRWVVTWGAAPDSPGP